MKNLQTDLFSQGLVNNINGELLVSSLIIAENIDVQHKNVLELIRKNLKDFEEFGRVPFEIASFENSGTSSAFQTRNSTGRATQIALLNENQSTLLITYLRNSELVKRFKINLVKAFAIMKDKLNNKTLSYEEIMQNALYLADKKVKELEYSNKALNNVIQEQKPKVAFANSVSASNDSILISAFAKAISNSEFTIGPHKLLEFLRKNRYLISSGKNYNLPIQKYIDNGYFEVCERTLNNPDGSIKIFLTTKITGRGQVAISKRIREMFALYLVRKHSL